MKNPDKKDELKIILDEKFKYTNEILADKIIELFDENIDEDDYYYKKKEERRLKTFKYELIVIGGLTLLAIFYKIFFN